MLVIMFDKKIKVYFISAGGCLVCTDLALGRAGSLSGCRHSVFAVCVLCNFLSLLSRLTFMDPSYYKHAASVIRLSCQAPQLAHTSNVTMAVGHGAQCVSVCDCCYISFT